MERVQEEQRSLSLIDSYPSLERVVACNLFHVANYYNQQSSLLALLAVFLYYFGILVAFSKWVKGGSCISLAVHFGHGRVYC